jgi:GNAT superfamily N-acetyltransferase
MVPRQAIIRRAAAADIHAIGRMGAQLLRIHSEFDPDRFMRPGPDAEQGYASFLESQLETTESLVLVAERNTQVVGYLYAAIEPPSWKELRERAGFIHDLFVEEPHRGVQIGDDLMNAALEWMHERQVARVLLWTAAPNEGARRVFERFGFRNTMIEMTKELG